MDMRRILVTVLLSGSVLLCCSCASQKLKLEMTREPQLIAPTISKISLEPSGRLNTYGESHDVTITMSGDSALAATFDLPGRLQAQEMRETSPGIYAGSFRVNANEEGSLSVVGHLEHKSTGARQEIRSENALELFVEAPAPPMATPSPDRGCSEAAAREFEAQLRPIVIRFDFNKREITPHAKEMLMGARAVVESHPDCTIQLHGHTDDVGSLEYNLSLSRERAEAVSSFLQQVFQLPASRLTTEGHGKSRPEDPAGTPEARTRNRRVELHTAPSN